MKHDKKAKARMPLVAESRRFAARAAAALVVLCLIGTVRPVMAAQLRVLITNVHSNRGNVWVALFSQAKGFPDGDYSDRHKTVRATTAPITVVFDDLKPGTYAVGAYHDENGNGKLDTDFIGYPAEGYALSRGVRAILWRPRFEDAAFTVGPNDTDLTLTIAY